MATREEIAWAAGLFEGEGSMSRRGVHGVQLHLGMTDRDTVERFAVVVGAGRIYEKRRDRPGWKPLFAWQLDKAEDVRRVLGAFLPWFSERRTDRAIEMLELLSKNPGAKKDWTECPYGHPLSGSNLYVHQKSGKRMCRACATERQRRWVTKQKAVS